jgi:predicted ATPase with chaperone activity
MSVTDASPNPSPEVLSTRPQNISDTGLAQSFLLELVAKHLYHDGVQTLAQLAARMTLSGTIVETLLDELRRQSCVEVLAPSESSQALRYRLTDAGRTLASYGFAKSGYLGPAPVPLEQYVRMVEAQSVRRRVVTRERFEAAFRDVVLPEEIRDRLGPALNSDRALLIYGEPGTGKTYVCRKLARLLGDAILVPHAIAVANSVIRFFDPTVHRPLIGDDCAAGIRYEGDDPRYVRCQRPVVLSGGELTLDMLELRHDPATRLTQAPVHCKANNGMYIIDDLGRQRVAPVDLLNRWIVPMEERVDYLTLETGVRFPIPFDVVLVFSTNLNPLDLSDPAFLRRLGYKIRFEPVSRLEYLAIWRQELATRGLEFDQETLTQVFDRYRLERRSMLPCHPRDLIGLAADLSRYRDGTARIDAESIAKAWRTYFVDSGGGEAPP